MVMAQDADDIDFSDDGFDDLPTNTLNDLEERARLSTQPFASTSQRPQKVARQPDLGLVHHSNLDPSARRNEDTFQLQRDSSAHQPRDDPPPFFDYDFEEGEEEVIDLDAQPAYIPNQPAGVSRRPDEVTQREQWRQQRYGIPSRQIVNNNASYQRIAGVNRADGQSKRVEHQNQANGTQANGGGAPTDQMNVDELRARVLQLESEKNALQLNVESAQSTVLSKAGEIAIVRANHDKAAKEYERRLAAMRSAHEEEVAKQRSELDIVRKSKETVETNNRFLEHDLAQEAEKARNAKKSFREVNDDPNSALPGPKKSPFSTPKKNKALPFRDGFDDDEVVVSPSRSFEKNRAGTPRAAGKRKRLQPDKGASPSQALQMSGSENAAQQDQSGTPTEATLSSTRVVEDVSDGKFDFIQDVLNHRVSEDKERTLEILTKYAFPSQPTKPLSSFLYDQFSPESTEQDLEQFRTRFCEILLTLWSRCLDESFHDPLYDVTELLQYILIVSSSSLSVTLLPRVVPLCLSTADLIVFPTARASKTPSLHHPPSLLLKSQINPLDYLDTLHLVALNCSLHKDTLTTFWTAIPFDFVLTMLHRAQPLSQIQRMLQLLLTSVLPTSFGAIHPTTGPGSPQQSKTEHDTTDRLTVLLFDTPLASPGPSPESLSSLRGTVLGLLTALARTPHGGELLATHRLAFARLTRFLHESVLALYAHPTPFPTAASAAAAAHVNAATLLLAHLAFAHAPALDVRARLAAAPGAAQRHLVALSRVAFGEGAGGVIERGIEAEAAEAAHRMLDVHLSPEEGEAVVEVFSSAKG